MDFLYKHAGTIGLLLFFTFFSVMVLWLFRPNTGKSYNKYGKIPLETEEENDG